MSGQWPPEWEDPDDGHPDAGLPDRDSTPGLGAELSEVTSFLASVRSPALPAAFEARISAAIAAEAAARASTEPPAAAERRRPGDGGSPEPMTRRTGSVRPILKDFPRRDGGRPVDLGQPRTPPRLEGVQERAGASRPGARGLTADAAGSGCPRRRRQAGCWSAAW